MKHLSRNQKIRLTVIEAGSVFLTVFINQMITTVFPAYPSVQVAQSNDSVGSPSIGLVNCTIENPSNVYVAILIGSKYCTELIMLPIVGWFADKYHPPLILFFGALVEAFACILYSVSGNFYSTLVARVTDAIGYSIISTSGLTLILTIYLKERSRNRMITIDSILVCLASAISPFVAGTIFETIAISNQNAARAATFMILCPLFITIAIAIVPFTFTNSYCSYYSLAMRICGKRPKQSMEEKQPTVEESVMIDQPSPDLPPEYHDNRSRKSDEMSHCKSEENCDEEVKDLDNTSEVAIKKSLNIVTLLRDPHVIIVLCSLLFNSLIGNSLETTLPIFMIRKFCSDQTEQGTVWLFGFLSLLGFFLSSFLFHYRPQLCWGLPFIGLLSTGGLCVCLFYCRPWWAIGICLGVMFFFSAMSEVILIPIIPQIIDVKYSKMYGSGSGLTLITFTLSGIIGSFPVGPVVEKFGFLTLCCILCLLNCVTAPFIFFIRKYFHGTKCTG